MTRDDYWRAQRVTDAEFVRVVSSQEETMKVYISNPISGIADHLVIANHWANRVRSMGGNPIIPQDIPPHQHDGECPLGYAFNPGGHSSACHLRANIEAMLECDAILLTPYWQRSRGCKFEKHVAQMCGLQVFFANQFSAHIRNTLFQEITSFSQKTAGT